MLSVSLWLVGGSTHVIHFSATRDGLSAGSLPPNSNTIIALSAVGEKKY